MTDRIHSITLALDYDIRDDDIEPLLIACGMLKHVIKVQPNITDSTTFAIRSRVEHELRQRVYDAINFT